MKKNRKVIKLYYTESDIRKLSALPVNRVAVKCNGMVFESIEEVPEELRHLVEKVLVGDDEAKNDIDYDILDE